MKLVLCCKNDSIMQAWQKVGEELSAQIQDCQHQSLAEMASTNIDAILRDSVILYHLPPDLNEEKALYTFLRQYPVGARMLVMVNRPEAEQGIRLLHAGVHGYANARLHPDKLKAAINVILQDEIWAGEEILRQLLHRDPNHSTAYRRDPQLRKSLSNREKQIVDEVLQGKTNKQVAIALNITERTVKAHLSSIFQKTGTRNRFELSIKLKSM